MKRIIRKIKSWFVPTPTEPFTWSSEDFETAKRWAKSQPHPDVPQLSLWDKVNGDNLRQDSAITLAKLNQILFNKEEVYEKNN